MNGRSRIPSLHPKKKDIQLVTTFTVTAQFMHACLSFYLPFSLFSSMRETEE